MSGTTYSFGMRYPTSGDNVAPLETVFKNLADDVDWNLGGGLQANTAIVHRIGKTRNTSSSGTFTAETVTDSISFQTVAGKEYEIEFIGLIAGTAGDTATLRIREDSVSGTAQDGVDITIASTGKLQRAHGFATWTAPSTTTKTFVATFQRTAGTGGTLQRVANATNPAHLKVSLVSA